MTENAEVSRIGSIDQFDSKFDRRLSNPATLLGRAHVLGLQNQSNMGRTRSNCENHRKL